MPGAFPELKPTIAIEISENPFGANALEYVNNVKIEMSLDKIDLITLEVANPILDQIGEVRTSKLLFEDQVAFMPGQIIEVYLGYEQTQFVAAGLIQKYMPSFPQTGMPTITVQAFGGGRLMMDGTPEINATASRRFGAGVSVIDMITTTLGSYGFDTAGVTTEAPVGEPAIQTVKKAGMADYQFVRGLANLIDYQFVLPWDPTTKQFKPYVGPPLAGREYTTTFTWGPDYAKATEGGALLEFNPSFAISNTPSDIELYYFDRDTRTWEKIIYPPEPPRRNSRSNTPRFRWRGDSTTATAELQSASSPTTGRGLRIQAGGISVEVLPSQNFNSAAEAVAWAEAWWRARQDQLITGRGKVVGWPFLRAGQIHNLRGLGPGLSGEWYVTDVTHMYDRGAGYVCDFQCRKVLP